MNKRVGDEEKLTSLSMLPNGGPPLSMGWSDGGCGCTGCCCCPFCPWLKDCLWTGVIGATGVDDVGVGGSSPFVVAGVEPVLAPFLFAGFYNQYQRCSEKKRKRGTLP